MSEPAPPAATEAPTRSGAGGVVLLGFGVGLRSAAVVTALGLALGMLEYMASGGLYRAWTWVKVGVLYVLSFCMVSVRADAQPSSAVAIHLVYRFSFLTGMALVLWLTARAGRVVARRVPDGRGLAAGTVAVGLGFAVPVFLLSLPATLRFPDLADVVVAPVRWESAVFPAIVAWAGALGGVYLERRAMVAERSDRWARAVAWIDGGWRMLLYALGFAFVGFLVLAAAKPDQTASYVRAMRSAGRVGALTVVHHVLLLPNQSVWTLPPSMGGATRLSVEGADAATVVRLDEIEEGALGSFFGSRLGSGSSPRLPLGGGFYLFLLVPLSATVLAGRQAGKDGPTAWERALRGAGSGCVFAVLAGVAAWVSSATLPLAIYALTPVVVRATMPSTALLALAWGMTGGVLGALTSPWGSRPAQDAGVAPG